MTETNVQKFYRILAEKTEAFGTKKEMMAQLGFEGAKLNSDRTRLNSDERQRSGATTEAETQIKA